MDFTERIFAYLKFHQLLTDMHGEQFESFFHRLMGALHQDFVPVRTHGNLGDLGADGLLLHGRTLHACFAPQTHDFAAVKAKLRSDLGKARAKRNGHFDAFAFVHNDIRGVHPQISVLLSETQEEIRPLRLYVYGKDWLWQEFMRLDRVAAEDLLGCPIAVQDKTYGIGLTDLEPLLRQLQQRKDTAEPLEDLPIVNQHKIEYNSLSAEVRDELVRALRHSYLVDEYYARITRVDEHDLVARGFRIYYDQLRQSTSDPELLWLELEKYVVGNERVTLRTGWAASVVIAHFFERCDVFDVPPPDWVPSTTGKERV
ncbi:hypothetical protein KQY30_06850 [Streptomyces sp. GMY02]|uniref:ABC-three component system protein n=1 Tax=Streptomyces sp. GMY02 TaxID=1333528 RepID=UPI001C2C5259|nr:ABC-three component system protein [Streptomyces sp. GMY02]QXE34051.1 hypothetical protein KQY30_06850 [Streptomyces sp. GMY02]